MELLPSNFLNLWNKIIQQSRVKSLCRITLRRRKTCAIFLHNLHVLGSFQKPFWVIFAGKLPDAAGSNTIILAKLFDG